MNASTNNTTSDHRARAHAIALYYRHKRRVFAARMVGAFAIGGAQAILVIKAFGLFGF